MTRRIFSHLGVALFLTIASLGFAAGCGGDDDDDDSSPSNSCSKSCQSGGDCTSVACNCKDGSIVNSTFCNNGCCADKTATCTPACDGKGGYAG